MRTLVTGGTGFIGSHLVERLRERGEDVLAVARDDRYGDVVRRAGVPVVLADLNNGESWDRLLDGVTAIYHVAGVTRCRTSREYYEGNADSTKHLLEMCRRFGSSLRRFVYVSSLTATGPSLDGTPLVEEAPYHPVSDYGRSKMLAEMEVLRMEDVFPTTIVRPCAVYGPRDRDMYAYICLIKKGIEPLIGFHDKFLSLIHVDDLIEGILLAGSSRASIGRTYFIASECAYSYHEIGVTIGRVLQCHPRCIRLPHALVYCIGAVVEGVGKITHQNVFFNLGKVKESIQPGWVCSVERAKAELGFQQHIDLEEGMRKTCCWYRDHGWLS